MKFHIILEKGEGELWGRVESPKGIEPGFLLTTVGESTGKVTDNLKDLIADFIEHEGQGSDYWKTVDISSITFDYQYELTELFEIFDVLKIGKVAQRAGINPSLMRQYASTVKFPSIEQAKKIEKAIHDLAKELLAVRV